MLKDLSNYENLGTPRCHFGLLTKILSDTKIKWDEKDVVDFFHNRIIDDRNVFDGCLPILSYTGIIEFDSEKGIIVNNPFCDFLRSESLFIDKFVEKLFFKLNFDSVFHTIFCSEYINYDIIYRSIQIDNSAFPFKYSNFKQLLYDFGVLQEHPTKHFNKYIINSHYKKIFDKVVLPEIKKRKIGIEEFQKDLERNQIYGEEAEKFVLDYEKNRLKGIKEAYWVAQYSVSDGYDIASFENELSEEYDRFIEVKSYEGNPYFFWSRNEIEVSRLRENSYYLYLVDRKKMQKVDYAPLIIRNPYVNVLKNESQWSQDIEKIKFRLIENG